MPAARPPLPVEVVTKVPVNLGGLGLADPGVTGGISRVAATAQSTVGRAAVDVVTDVPGQLRNITPLTFGQKAAQIGKISVSVGSKVLGVGLGVLGNLAQDLLFPEPVGVGSDMVGGVKIGSQPNPAPITAPVTSQAIAKPQVTGQPFKPPAPVVAPVAAPAKPKPQTQTQTKTQPQVQPQPLPQPTTTRPQSAPVQTQPKPINLAAPAPRSALETPSPTRLKPLNTESPFPLNLVELNSYGGVNLTYPIAQKLTGLTREIEELLQPGFEQIQLKLNELPQTFEEILKNAHIETTVNLPTKIDLVSQIPFQLDLSKQVPVSVDLSKQIPVAVDLKKEIPVAVDLSSQIPLTLDLSKQVPVTVDLRKEIPVTADLTSLLPLAVNLTSQIPFQLNLSKQIFAKTDLTAQIPFQLDLSKQIPVSVDLSKKVPVSVDLSAILQPDSELTDLKKLQECCEEVGKMLKKKAEIFEGRGDIVCGEGSTPYSYRGEGLNGIHQLLKIMLGANQQILEHVCDLNIEYPLIQGGGTYGCGTLPPITYNYSGLGFIGIQNQIDQLFGLDKKILNEVCSIAEVGSLGSLPDISGRIEYFDCDYSTQAILYSGNGIQGLSSQVDALSSLVKVGLKASCDTSAIVLMPDMRSEQFKASRQLVITWGTQYPTQKGSLWHSYIPNPIDGLDWCTHFENLSCTKGNILGRLFWENSKMHTGIYCSDEGEARRVIALLAALSNASPELSEEGILNPRISKGGKVKRKPAERNLRAVRAAIVEIGADGESESVICLRPPLEGCLPTLL